MRISIGILASATVFFALGAAGLLGTWALSAATVLGLIGGIWAVTVMESREHSDVVAAGLAPRRGLLMEAPASARSDVVASD
ncbi:MAG: hypothetical protein ABIY48_02325 [Acidimicrobiales bacterium]